MTVLDHDRRLAWPALALLCVALSAAPAAADTIAVLGVSGQGTRAFHSEVTDVLLEAASSNPELELVDRHDVTTEDALGLLGCSEPSIDCMNELAGTLEVDRVLAGSIEGQAGANELALYYYDAVIGDFLMNQRAPYETASDRLDIELRLAAVVGNRVVLRIVSEREDVRIEIDDEYLGEAPILTRELEPGRHTLVATCDGCQELTRVMSLSAGRVYTEEVNPSGAVAGGGDGGGEVAEAGSPYLFPAVTLGVGVVLMGTGLVFGLKTNSTQSDFDETQSYEEALDLADDGDTFALLTNVFLISGAAVTATAILLFLTADSRVEQPRQRVDAGPTASPWVGVDGGGVLMEWNF